MYRLGNSGMVSEREQDTKTFNSMTAGIHNLKEQYNNSLQRILDLQQQMGVPVYSLQSNMPSLDPNNIPIEVSIQVAAPDRIGTDASGFKPPAAIYQPLPRYTQQAREAKIEGELLLQAKIEIDGRVDDIRVLKSLGYGLDESAIDTIRPHWFFRAGTVNGTPLVSTVKICVSFKLY